MKMQFSKSQAVGGTITATLASLVLVLGLSPAVVSAEDTVPVDLFSTGQPLLVDDSPGDGGLEDSVGDGTDPTILGGARDIFVELLTRSTYNPAGKARLSIAGGAMSFSTSSLSTGTGTVQWDGVDDSIALVPTGLGGIDLTAGGAVTQFEVETLFSDLGYEFVVTAWTGINQWTSISFSATEVNPGPATSFIPFAAFTDYTLCGVANPAPGVNLITCAPNDNVVDLTNLGALELKIDPNGGTVAVDLTLDSIITRLPPTLACRFTGGGVDTDLNWDHTLEDGEMQRGNGAGNLPDNIDRYQFGGQAGANTGQQPQPKGEWTHHQQTGPSGSFTFHAGTASAPSGTEVDKITCSDPGFCQHARPAPAKQLDFEGVGTFKNIGKGQKAPVWKLDENNENGTTNANVDTGKGNKTYDGTYHWFEVNIDDLGEPKVENTTPIENCPVQGFGVNGDPTEPADCGCPDFYRIRIYEGVYQVGGEVIPNKTEVIYEAYGYVDGGNLQIHPPTGFDLK